MPEKYVPKHRSEPARPVLSGARQAVYLSGAALVVTTVTIGSGVLAEGSPAEQQVSLAAAEPTGVPALSEADLAAREQAVSRSTERRVAPDAAKAAALDADAGEAVTRTEDLAEADPRTLAKALLPRYGMSAGEFGCLNNLWNSESGWNVRADNPTSSAYGIPQALPGSKMASAGADWRTSAETQIRWGLGYIKNRYGTPCSAWSFKQGNGYY